MFTVNSYLLAVIFCIVTMIVGVPGVIPKN